MYVYSISNLLFKSKQKASEKVNEVFGNYNEIDQTTFNTVTFDDWISGLGVFDRLLARTHVDPITTVRVDC
jgi:hypothetical protein